jgi:hypothetical protein
MRTIKSTLSLVFLAMHVAAIPQAFAEWSVSSSTSPLTGVTTTTLETSSNYGRFRIYCSTTGDRGYYLATDYITNDGFVSYRVGTNAVVSQTWSESPSNGYQVLFPPSFDLTLIQRLYQNWDFVFQYNSFVNGSPIIEMNASGLPEAIDATRTACNWPTDVLPPGNGWGAPLPAAAPGNAKEATYVPNAANQFRLIAWRDTNAQGKLQLLARLGDANGPCSGPFVISDHRLYVSQNGKFVSAVSGTDFQTSCHSPVIVALNGDFDPSGSLTLTSYPFHYHTTDPGSPMGMVSFDQNVEGPPGAAANYQGLWFNPAEAGWGINFAHQGDLIFASWFTYDLAGKDTWLVMTATKTGPDTYSGQLFQGTGPAFDAVPFPPLGSPGGAVVGGLGGTATVTFTDPNNGTLTYTLADITQMKSITRELIGPQPTCVFGAQANLALAINYTDLWWASPAGSEAGWGINLTHQGDIIFGTWFTYDHDHTPRWMVMTANKTAPGVYAATQVFRLSGPTFSQTPFPAIGAPGGPVGVVVGSASFTFANGNAATFSYTIDGETQSKLITREVFNPPGTTCQ